MLPEIEPLFAGSQFPDLHPLILTTGDKHLSIRGLGNSYASLFLYGSKLMRQLDRARHPGKRWISWGQQPCDLLAIGIQGLHGNEMQNHPDVGRQFFQGWLYQMVVGRAQQIPCFAIILMVL